MPLDLRPACKTCFFSKVKEVTKYNVHVGVCPPPITHTEAVRFCLHDPIDREKADDDFCRHHPAWPEFESLMDAKHISAYHGELSERT